MPRQRRCAASRLRHRMLDQESRGDAVTSDLEATFAFYWRTLAPTAPEPEREWRFDTDRKWRFDFAWPIFRLAVEVDGGTWAGGRHTRGGGYERDAEKLNAAALAGWRVVRLTRGMLGNDPERWIDAIRTALDAGRGGEG
jgi:hypothetical protein